MASSNLSSSSSSSSSSMSSRSAPANPRRRACLCAPATHPGSFRCSLHRGRRKISAGAVAPGHDPKARSMRALLVQMIRPSSREHCRRGDFQRRPTRFCPSANGGDHGSVPGV